jgi:2'-5' RNA ligase
VSEQARLFVAATLPEPVRGELARWARRAVPAQAGVRRLDPESLHLTLCFLGAQPLASAGELAGVLGALAPALAAVGELAVGAPAWLPPRRPRALAVEIGDPAGGLRQLQAALARDVAATIDWAAPRQRFRPHVTVARLRPGTLRSGGELAPTPPLLFTCERVVLFRSHLEPEGARYIELASVGGW